MENTQIISENWVDLGYRGFSVHGTPGRAGEFISQQSGPTLGTRILTTTGPLQLNLDGRYLSDDEFNIDAVLSTKSLVRLSLRSERFFHNLDHIPYDNGYTGIPDARNLTGIPGEGSRPDSTGAAASFNRRIYYTDPNPNATYGLQIDLNEVKARVKCPDYPAHFNIAYWRFEKEGEKQQRFLDHRGASAGCGACHMQSKSRSVDMVTEEVKASVDAHAGFLDIVMEGLFRTFRERESTPVDRFYPGNILPHDETPDSKLREFSLKLNTAPSGGLVGSASFTIGKRENQSELASEGPIKAETDYTKTSADVTYTPNEKWTVSMRYRLLDMDSDNSDTLTRYANAPDSIPVREAIDITRAWYEGVVNYRPWRSLTLKAELRREDIERDLGPGAGWELPEEEIVTRVKLGFTSRLLEKSALKLSGWAALQRSDDPAYGTSAEESRELFLSATYAPAGRWGLAGSVGFLEEENDGRTVQQVDRNNLADVVNFDLARKHKQQRFNFGGWLIPADGVTLDLNYGFFRTAIDQDLLFGTDPHSANSSRNITVEDEGADYRQSVQTVSLGATWTPRDDLSCRLEGYHIRSKAYFSPEFYRDGLEYVNGSFVGVSSSADLRDISKVNIVQNGIKGRVSWQIDDNLTCGLEATFDDYDEKGNNIFDGSVQSYMASLTYTF
jgi:hypothetical protein